MADRTSTIRMKVVGAETVKNDLSQLEAQIRKMETYRDRAMKVRSQKVEGGLPTGPQAQEVETLDRMARGLKKMRDMTNASFEQQRRDQLKAASDTGTRKEGLQQIAAAQMGAKAKAKIDETSLHFTETVTERKLRILDEGYARERALHAGNAQALAKIDQAYTRQRTHIAGEDEGGIGKKMLGSLKGFGARMVARQSVSQLTQSISGSSELSQGANLVVGSFLYGGAALGAVGTAASVLSTTLNGMNEANKSATQAAVEFSDRLTSLSIQLAAMGQGNATTTSFGSAAGQVASQASANQIKVAERFQDLAAMSVGKVLGTGFERLFMGRTMWQTGIGREMQVIKDETEINDMVYADAQTASDKQSWIAEQDDRQNTEHMRRITVAQGLPDGRNQQWKVLNAQFDMEKDSVKQTHKMQTAEAEFSAEESDKILDKLTKQREEMKKKGQLELLPAMDEKITAAARASIEADKVVKSLPERQRNESDRLHYGHEARRKAMEKSNKKEDEKQTQDLEVSKIQLANDGWTAQRKALISQYDFKIKQAEEAGDDTSAMGIEADKKLKVGILDKDHARTVKNTEESLKDQYLVVTRQKIAADAEWAARSRQLYLERGADGAASIEAEKVLFYNLQKAKEDMMLADLATQKNITLGMIHGTMSPYAMQAEQMRKDRPGWSPAKIQDVISGRMKVDSARLVKGERMQANPMLRYKEYEKQMQQAVNTGEITHSEAQRRLMAKTGELAGPRVAGQFMDAMSYMRSVQSTLSGDASIPKETRDGILKLNKQWDDFMNMGVRLYG